RVTILVAGAELRSPATASTKEGATKVANCFRGRNRHNPVSSIHVRASSKVRVPTPFWRILSERDASSCSAVKEKPHFQAGEITCRMPLLRATRPSVIRPQEAFGGP